MSLLLISDKLLFVSAPYFLIGNVIGTNNQMCKISPKLYKVNNLILSIMYLNLAVFLSRVALAFWGYGTSSDKMTACIFGYLTYESANTGWYKLRKVISFL